MKVQQKISHLLRRSGDALYRIASWVEPPSPTLSPEEERNIPWNAIRGDETLRLDYDLNEDSVVFDLGGYKGQWACDIFAMYGCWLHIFEPVEEFACNIERRFAKNRKVTVYPFGLAHTDGTVKMAVTDSDWSSIYRSSTPGTRLEDCKLVRAVDFLQANNIQIIDLMKINIEGAEYDLLEHLIECRFVSRIKNIQIQFHDFVPQAECRMHKIQESLAQTHCLTYQYTFLWENWRLKDDN